MIILITGATGFIGQHLLDELQNDHFTIRVLSRKERPKFWCANKNFDVYRGDVSDKSTMDKAFTGVDVVINLAAELRVNQNFESTNVTGTQNIIDLAEKNKVKKIIHLSSVGVVGMQYSRKKIVVDENTSCHPQSGYERTKFQSEVLLNEFTKKNTAEINILRPTNVFGDHHPRQALLGFLQRIKSGGSLPAADGAIANYVYAKDVAYAIRYCLLNSIGNKTFNVGESIPFKDFYEIACRQLNVKGNIKSIPSFIPGILEPLGYFGIKKIKAQLRGVSNCVEYADAYMKNTVGYKYGIRNGLLNSILFYKLK